MSTLPAITEALCKAVAKRDYTHARALAFQAAAKMGGARGHGINNYLQHEGDQPMPGFVAVNGGKIKHWNAVHEPREPWIPMAVKVAVEDWLAEVRDADALTEAGERVQPLLLVGETRCGKTSMLCALAARLGLPVMRLSLADVVDSHLGENARRIRDAVEEMKTCPPAVWLVDEIDAIALKREGGSGAAQERAHAVGSLLTELDTLPARLPLAATSNLVDTIDSAVLGRFTVVEFPTWQKLSDADREAFAASHGARAVAGDSYAEVVKACRKRRVEAVIAKVSKEAA